MPSPTKWINSWFVRQRKKARDAAPSAEGAVSMDVIDKFKAEYQDPILVDARDNGITHSDNIPVRTKAHPGRSNKVKTERKDGENAFPILISLPPPFPKVPSDKMEIPNPAPLSSKFILREMVPRVWMPPGPHRPPILGPPTLNSSSTPAARNQCRPHFSAYTTPQIQVSDIRTTVLQPTFHDNTFPVSPFLSDTHIPATIPLRTQHGISDTPHLPASGPQRSHSGYQRQQQQQQQQQQSRPHRVSNLGPGRITDRKLQARFNVPLSAPSIFTTELESVYKISCFV
ncbi:hypothetical protein BDZ94DRAFT_1245904 [Collybia nuda]|uniref:Uncharacterized protein n=1 Tax=Collybia nuda TaxID=64659 RepID=A0A9P5YHB6_9AGAR|nr:hypothetical protein BDZ94DRAFT_1245904 [Collybia nuda]